jgi:hypothetical protein
MKKTAPTPKRKPDWKAHFHWLRSKSHTNDAKVLKEFEDSRRRLVARERAMGNLASIGSATVPVALPRVSRGKKRGTSGLTRERRP